jgi:tripartite-type tricarboxylate transporter receptor subunit TctC
LTLRSAGDKTAGGRFFIGVRPRPYLNSKPEESVRSVQSLLSALGLVASLMLGVTPSTAQTLAQTWPQRTVKLLLPLGPGSGVDIGARLLADRLSKRWGQPVVVENRPGGDAIVAISAFVGAHDDHILLASPTSSFTAHPYLHDDLPYKPSDLLPIARVSNTLITIAVPKSLNVGSLAELVALVRAQPGKLNWAGVTGALDFLFAGFLNRAGLTMTKVPYRNPVEAANDLGEGRVQVYESALAIVRPQLQAGKIKLLAVTNSVRAPTEPDVPTVKEAGYPELTLDGLVGFFGPPGMPNELRERIAADVRAVAADPVIGARLADTGQILNVGGPAEFAAATEEQRAKIAAIAKDLGIKPAQ